MAKREAVRDWSVPSMVYFVRAGTQGPIKIGSSDSLGSRMRSLQTGCAEPIVFLVAVPGGKERERDYHMSFRRWRQSGEWFSPNGPLWAEMYRVADEPGALVSDGFAAMCRRYRAEQSGEQMALPEVEESVRYTSPGEAADMAAAILAQLRGGGQ